MAMGNSSGEVWVEWVTGDDRLEGGQQRHTLLPEGGEITVATNVAKKGSEGPGQGHECPRERRS
jgi:hypothetical protein